MNIRRVVIGLSMLAAATAAEARDALTVDDYPQAGLYAHWDAILNSKAGGQRVHNGAANVWSDLTGRFDLTYTASGSPNWSDNGYVSGKSVAACMVNSNSTFWTGLGGTWTIQAYVVPTEDWIAAQSYSGICGYHSTTDKNVSGLLFGQYSDWVKQVEIYTHGNGGKREGFALSKSDAAQLVGKPVLLTLVASPATFRFYLNDKLQYEFAATSATDTTLNAPRFQLGAAYDAFTADNVFNGSIHSVRVYSRALTTEEILHSYGIDRVRFGIAPGDHDAALDVYAFLDYVEADGHQQLNTGIWSQPGLVAEADITPTTNETLLNNRIVFGHKWDVDGFLLAFCEGKIRFHVGGVYKDLAQAQGVWQPGERLHFRGSSRGYEVNGVWTDFEGQAADENPTRAIGLFNVPGQSNKFGSFKLHRFSLWDGTGVCLRDYLPAKRTSDDAVGLYDVVSGRFDVSSGTSLIAGPELSSLLLVLPKNNGRTYARFTVQPLTVGETPVPLTAVLSHAGKTEELSLTSLSSAMVDPFEVEIDGLKPNTDYRVVFTAGSVRYPTGDGAIAFRTQPEGVADGGYAPLDFAESTGTEKLNLQIRPNGSLVTALDFTPHDATKLVQPSAIFGTEYKVTGYLLMFAYDDSQLSLRFDSCGDWKDVDSSAWSVGQRVKAVCTTTGFDVNGTWTPMTGTQADKDKDLWLLTTPDWESHAGWRAAVRIHGCVISNRHGGVMRDYVPVRRNSDNVVGLYDRVNDEFRPSASGAFVAGNEVAASWLKATATNRTGRTLGVTLARSARGAADVYAAWGKGHAPEIASAWENVRKVGTFAADADSASVSVRISDPAVRYVRFFTSDGCWSASLTLTDVPMKPQGLILTIY